MIVLLVTTTFSQAKNGVASPSELIAQANIAMDAGDYASAVIAVGGVLERSKKSVPRAERAEAYRILALAHFYEERVVDARQAFLEYLLLDPDAHLDPALVAPEAISLLEDVRARNLAEIDLHRKKTKRYLLLNLVPGAGQFQNGEHTKGYLFAGSIGLLLGANITTYFLLKSYCDPNTLTCSTSTGTATKLRAANFLSGVGAIGLYLYSIMDGYKGFRRLQANDSAPSYMSFSVTPTSGGTSVGLSLIF